LEKESEKLEGILTSFSSPKHEADFEHIVYLCESEASDWVWGDCEAF